MDKRTLKVLEFNIITDRLADEAVCMETAEKCRTLMPSVDIYEAQHLLSQTEEAESLIIKKGAPPISPVRNIVSALKRSSVGGVLSMGELLSVSHVLRIARTLISYSKEDDFSQNYPQLYELFSSLCENKKA